MIIEPTGWGVECDHCDVELTCEDARDEADAHREARKAGWIVVALYEFCSLDCLLHRRAKRLVRDAMAAVTRQHMATHTDRCCRLHRTHATRGRHHWADCPDPKLAGMCVL